MRYLQVPTECVKSVKFSFFSDEDVRKISVKKITKDQYLDVMGRPEPGGLYDPHLGPLEETVSYLLSLSLSLSHMLNLLTLEYNEPFVVVVVVKLGPFSIGFFIVLTKLVNKNRWRGEVVVLTNECLLLKPITFSFRN